MAGVLGFEPRNAGIKTRCLTAWLHPIKKFHFDFNLCFHLHQRFRFFVVTYLAGPVAVCFVYHAHSCA